MWPAAFETRSDIEMGVPQLPSSSETGGEGGRRPDERFYTSRGQE